MCALHELEADAIKAIRAFTPACFQNLLTRDLEKWADRFDGQDMRVEPEIGTILANHSHGEVNFSVRGRLHVGSHGRCAEVIIHGVRDDDDDQPGFRSVEFVRH